MFALKGLAIAYLLLIPSSLITFGVGCRSGILALMTIAVTFALCSLFAAGFLDICFKRYSEMYGSRGVYFAICGLVWTLFQLTYYWIKDLNIIVNPSTIGYGASAGVCLALANLVFIESLRHLNVSLGSTIYRLNTVGVVILAVIVLGEPVSALKVLGVMIAVTAVWMLYENPERAITRVSITFFLWLAILASVMRAAFGIVAKAGLSAGADADAAILVYAILWIPLGLVYAKWWESDVRLTGPTIAHGAVTGLLLCLVANFLIASMKLGEASTVVPIANLSFVVALIISASLGMERLTWRKGQAVILAGVAIYVLAQA